MHVSLAFHDDPVQFLRIYSSWGSPRDIQQGLKNLPAYRRIFELPDRATARLISHPSVPGRAALLPRASNHLRVIRRERGHRGSKQRRSARRECTWTLGRLLGIHLDREQSHRARRPPRKLRTVRKDLCRRLSGSWAEYLLKLIELLWWQCTAMVSTHGSRRNVWLVCAATAAGVKGSAKVVPLYQSFHWSRK